MEIQVIFFFIMFLSPALFALVIHDYLRHGQLNPKRKFIMFLIYLVIVNLIIYIVSSCRGVKRIDFKNMTDSYKYKYFGLGILLAFIIPFPVCLLTEDIITLQGFKRYIVRFYKDLKKFLPYAIRSAKSDLRSEVAGSYLNWLWWLIEPFCMMIIYAVIFGIVFNASELYFPIFIFIGITMWSFFSRSISGSVDTVRNNKGIITKIYMPKYILLISKMFVNAFKMFVSFLVIFVMMIVFRVVPTLNILFAIPILIDLFLFSFGIGTIMMHYGVFVSDLSYITGIVLSMMMYFTGTFYSVCKRIPAPFGEIIEMYNPIAYFISSMRNVLLYGTKPNIWLLLLWFGISVIFIALGSFTIYSNENSYVKVI